MVRWTHVIGDLGAVLARITHECRREAVETEGSRGLSQARPNENSRTGRED